MQPLTWSSFYDAFFKCWPRNWHTLHVCGHHISTESRLLPSRLSPLTPQWGQLMANGGRVVKLMGDLREWTFWYGFYTFQFIITLYQWHFCSALTHVMLGTLSQQREYWIKLNVWHLCKVKTLHEDKLFISLPQMFVQRILNFNKSNGWAVPITWWTQLYNNKRLTALTSGECDSEPKLHWWGDESKNSWSSWKSHYSIRQGQQCWCNKDKREREWSHYWTKLTMITKSMKFGLTAMSHNAWIIFFKNTPVRIKNEK